MKVVPTRVASVATLSVVVAIDEGLLGELHWVRATLDGPKIRVNTVI